MSNEYYINGQYLDLRHKRVLSLLFQICHNHPDQVLTAAEIMQRLYGVNDDSTFAKIHAGGICVRQNIARLRRELHNILPKIDWLVHDSYSAGWIFVSQEIKVIEMPKSRLEVIL